MPRKIQNTHNTLVSRCRDLLDDDGWDSSDPLFSANVLGAKVQVRNMTYIFRIMGKFEKSRVFMLVSFGEHWREITCTYISRGRERGAHGRGKLKEGEKIAAKATSRGDPLAVQLNLAN